MDKTSIHSIITGGCLCKGVRYRVTGALRPVVACHCRQCQKTSGHYVSATAAYQQDFRLTASTSLKWYQSSATAERGFCSECGGNLFWRALDSQTISIFAGTLDDSYGLQTVQHIFVADKASYYKLTDNLPTSDTFEIRVTPGDTELPAS